MKFGPAGRGSYDWVTGTPSTLEKEVCEGGTCRFFSFLRISEFEETGEVRERWDTSKNREEAVKTSERSSATGQEVC